MKGLLNDTLRVIALQSSTQAEWMPTQREETALAWYLGDDLDYNKLAREYEAAMNFEREVAGCGTLTN